jgi:hypothetical protein
VFDSSTASCGIKRYTHGLPPVSVAYLHHSLAARHFKSERSKTMIRRIIVRILKSLIRVN